GSAGKLVNNLLFAGNLALAKRCLDLGERSGIPRKQLLDFLSTGSARSFGLTVADALLGPNASRHGADLIRKDVVVAKRFAARTGTGSDVAEWVEQQLTP
ncbi:MAG: NAD-binding protein, partial [Chloroflexi bacterium]|nr:NAD-binding protein [Chloroflexota bacterium]